MDIGGIIPGALAAAALLFLLIGLGLGTAGAGKIATSWDRLKRSAS
jgi:hypothetical protein